MHRRTLLSLASIALAFAGAPAAVGQVLPVASESFDYPFPSLLDGQMGGTGWLNAWISVGAADLVVQANAPTNPANPFPWPEADAIGNYCQQAIEFGASWRLLDQTGHADIIDSDFGADGATMWFSFTTKQFQQGGDHYGGFSLWSAAIGEDLFIGSPWASYGWGIDDQQGTPTSAPVVPGSDNSVSARLVARVDWLPGDERVRLWVDPPVPHPTTTPPDIDHMMPDFRFDEFRVSSGGSGSLFYWDNLVIEKGVPGGPVGTSYCGPAIPNSTGNAATIVGVGSTSVGANDLTLTADSLPAGQFGYFLTGRTQGFLNPPGSSGIICLAGDIGRYNSGADIIQGPTGSLVVDLTDLPTNTPGSQVVMSGESINFQCWYRDGGTSNFTDGLNIVFN